MLDLEPAARVLTGLVAGVRDEQLNAPTPCTGASLGDLLDHVDGFALAFTAAATKTPLAGASVGPSADASRLGVDWRVRIPAHLKSLARAWQDEAAWIGMTEAGGQALPAEVAGIVALNEVIVHGWDIALASGQMFTSEPDLVEAAYGFVQSTVAQHPHGNPGLFGPPVTVPDDAALLLRLLGMTGRDPALHLGGLRASAANGTDDPGGRPH